MTTSTDLIPFAATDLHVYRIDDESWVWWYVATSQNAALEHFVRDIGGGTVAEYLRTCPETKVELTADNYALTVHGVDEPEGEEERTLTCAEWAREFGDGECVATNVDE